MNTCEGCIYYRPINAWGDKVMACWYTEDTGMELIEELFGDDDFCYNKQIPEQKEGER